MERTVLCVFRMTCGNAIYTVIKKQYIFFYYDTLVHPMERSVCFVLYCNKTNSMTDCAS